MEKFKKVLLIFISFSLVFVFSTFAYANEIVCISLGGSSSTDIHSVIKNVASDEGITLNTNNNWKKDKGDMICSTNDADRVRDKLKSWPGMDTNSLGDLNLLIVAKSAGGVLAWNVLKRHFGTIDDYNKVAVVLVDPHGSVTYDDRVGTYCKRQSLYWPSSFSTNKDFFRVFNIYQHSNGLTGASFPSSNVYKNIKLSGSSVSHDNIPDKPETKELIREAIKFLKN